VSGRPTDQSTQLGHPPHLYSHYYHSGDQETATPPSVDDAWKFCFYISAIQRICLFSDDSYSDSTPILTAIAGK
jgi:hypothetical protein